MSVIVLCVFTSSDQYLAPEVLKKQPYDNTVDWWCLGSVLYEMLFGLVSFYFEHTPDALHLVLQDAKQLKVIFSSLVVSYLCRQRFLILT